MAGAELKLRWEWRREGGGGWRTWARLCANLFHFIAQADKRGAGAIVVRLIWIIIDVSHRRTRPARPQLL